MYNMDDPSVRIKVAEFERIFKKYDIDGSGTYVAFASTHTIYCM
jgi:hypothetical protein